MYLKAIFKRFALLILLIIRQNLVPLSVYPSRALCTLWTYLHSNQSAQISSPVTPLL